MLTTINFDQDDVKIMAKTLFGEARGEVKSVGIDALRAVGSCIINRYCEQTWYGKKIKEICLKPFQFSCWNKTDPNYPLLMKEIRLNALFDLCLDVSLGLLTQPIPTHQTTDLTLGSNHYHALGILPHWAKTAKQMTRIGHHLFYKL